MRYNKMLTKKEIISDILTIRGIIDNDDPNNINKINVIDYYINRILLGSIKGKK